jgi:hypothetical protein
MLTETLIVLTIVLPSVLGLVGLVYLFNAVRKITDLMWAALFLIPSLVLMGIAIVEPTIYVADTLNTGIWVMIIGIVTWGAVAVVFLVNRFVQRIALYNWLVVILLFVGGLQIMLGIAMHFSEMSIIIIPWSP